MQTLTQMSLAVELAEEGLSHTKIATPLGRHRKTIELHVYLRRAYELETAPNFGLRTLQNNIHDDS